jgi:hypothetical protein
VTVPDDATAAALRRIADGGSDLNKPMQMDFFVAIPSQAAGMSVAEVAKARGFATSVEYDSETDGWTCYCTTTIVPAYAAVVEIEEALDAIARRYGGYADGFGSFGNAEVQ